MRTLLLTALAATLPLTDAPGQRAAERSPAERIVELTGFESVGFDAARAAFRPVLEEFRAEGYDPKVLREIESAADAFFHKVMTDPALKTGAAKLYQETFSDEELEELLLFYQTPLGRKALVAPARDPAAVDDPRPAASRRSTPPPSRTSSPTSSPRPTPSRTPPRKPPRMERRPPRPPPRPSNPTLPPRSKHHGTRKNHHRPGHRRACPRR